MAGSAPSNSSAVDFEKQQAAEADAKEAKRQADLTAGQAAIDKIFTPQPVMQTTESPFNWSSFTQPTAKVGPGAQPGGVPAGYTAVQIPGKASTSAASNQQYTPSDVAPGGGGASSQYASHGLTGNTPTYGASGSTAAAAPSTWGLEDASGKIYNPGDPLSITSQTPDPSGKTTGGFGDDFYNAYNKKVLDYYQPAEQKQYQEAQRGDLYNYARAGTLQSSAYADQQGERGYEDSINKANIVANANAQTGQLRDQIQANKTSLINQLYATEDPTLAANMAQSSAKASLLQDPTLTPMANLFTPAVAGATGAIGNLNNPYSVPANPYGAGGGTAPVTSSLGGGSSKLSGGGYS